MEASETALNRPVSSPLDHLDEAHAEPIGRVNAGTVADARVAPNPSGFGPRLHRLYRPIEGQLAEVEEMLRGEMQSPHEDVYALLRHGIQLGGKRLRPSIHLLVAEALGGATRTNCVIATVLEMVHTATLVHDDVLDNASTRRHVQTINSRWDNHTSILLGDYLFAQSFRLAATLQSTRTCRWVGEAARRVCQGELRQVLARDDLSMDQATYIQIIRGKTAELCRVACSLAAAEAGLDDDAIEQLATYGDCLGIAFQIADDYLDFWGDGSQVGKTLGTDIEQGKITLPVIRLLDTAEADQREQIISELRSDSVTRLDAVRHRLQASDAGQYTITVAESYKNRALQGLDGLPECKAKESLVEIAEFSIRRSF